VHQSFITQPQQGQNEGIGSKNKFQYRAITGKQNSKKHMFLVQRGLQKGTRIWRCTDVEWHNIYLESGFSYVGQALKKMNLHDLVTVKEDYCPF
jgi:uncharacterized cupin superfamily protein